MAYYLSCRDVGIECDFETYGETLEEVIEHCAEHGQQEHDMRSIGIELYSRMRPHVKVVETPSD